MKKLLALLGVISLGVTGTSAVVACGPADQVKDYGLFEDTVKVLSDIVNKQAKDDIKDQINKDWTYDHLFGIEQNDEITKFWDGLLYNKVSEELAKFKVKDEEDKDVPKYSEEDIDQQRGKVHTYIQDGLSLAYINDKAPDSFAGGNQEVKKIFTDEDAIKDGKYRTLEEMFMTTVKDQWLSDPENDKDATWDEIMEAYPHASLGFIFADKGNVKLQEQASEHFWTFTFITENPED